MLIPFFSFGSVLFRVFWYLSFEHCDFLLIFSNADTKCSERCEVSSLFADPNIYIDWVMLPVTLPVTLLLRILGNVTSNVIGQDIG